jgi:CHAT domain-containing protein
VALTRLIEQSQNAHHLEERIIALETALKLEPLVSEWPLAVPRDLMKAALLSTLGDAYRYRSKGESAENLEKAIESYEAALALDTRSSFPEGWARAQHNLADTYLNRLWGDRAENIEQAIKAFEAALGTRTREAFPKDWADTQGNLSIAYANRVRGVRADNIERSIKGFEAVLTIFTPEAFPREWVTTQNNLANDYRIRVVGDHAENIERAIKICEVALVVGTRDAYPEEWAQTQHNLGLAFADRIQGDRAENFEQAIQAYQAALIVRTSDEYPADWAHSQNNLGLALVRRLRGVRAENIEQAIQAYQAALTIRTRDAYPEDWAQTQHNLGDAFFNRIRGDRADNLELAIKAYESALTVFTPEKRPRDWARAQARLANAYAERIAGDHPENFRLAIQAYQAALTIWTRDAYPINWALTQNDMGFAHYQQRMRSDRASNLEFAIKAYEAALTVLAPDANPQEWALTKRNLANAYVERAQGGHAGNIEQAIEVFQSVLGTITREAFPDDWAHTQTGLGLAYFERIRGDRATNIELAIKSHDAVLTVRTRDADPLEWSRTQVNRGIAYIVRIHGNREKNLEEAIKSFQNALTVPLRDSFPREWAKAHSYLGVSYRHRLRGDPASNREKSIQLFQAALTVLTRDTFAQDWAETLTNLGNAYWERTQGRRADNIEQAIKAYEDSLTLYTRADHPEDWASAQNNLGRAYVERIEGARSENLARATNAFEAALSVRTAEGLPRAHLQTALQFGQVFLLERNWAGAREIYESARKAFLLLFGQGLDEVEARNLIENVGPLFAEAAYAEAEMGHRASAFNLLNEGKARLVTIALRQQVLDLPPEKQMQLAALKAEIREKSHLVERLHGTEGAQALQQLSKLRRELGDLLLDGLAKGSPEDDVMALMRTVLPKGGAIVAPIVTKIGGKVLIVTAASDGPAVTVLDLPDLTSDRVEKLLRGDGQAGAGGWFGAYNIQYLPRQQKKRRIGEWHAAIEDIGPTLWILFVGRLDEELERLGVKPGGHLIWIPAGALGLLPLGLARHPTSGREFGDTYDIGYAPNLEALLSASRQLSQTPAASLVAVVNPTGNMPMLNLPFAEIEGSLVMSHFAGNSLVELSKSNATPAAVLSALKSRSYWHFASHGFFDWNDARKSGLHMRGIARLTISDLLEAEDSLSRPRLVVLSACETGLYDATWNPDEFVGFPATFMQLGAAGVLSALWRVDDLATALLMAKFYNLHLHEKLPPATALKQAQSWMRTATRAELADFSRIQAAKAKLDSSKLAKLDSKLKSHGLLTGPRSSAFRTMLPDGAVGLSQNSHSHPFAHPYYWGGFVYTGL